MRGRKLYSIGRASGCLLLPVLPVATWHYSTDQDRKAKMKEVSSRIRIPNVQSVDDLLIEKCKVGDIILFDRRCHKCANGPLAAFNCVLGKALLCSEKSKTADIGHFEHAGIIVPGYVSNNKAQTIDPSNLLVLEATPSEGIVARPLLRRLELSQSRTILLLPLASPGERRNDEHYEATPKTKQLEDHLNESLCKFRDTWTSESKTQNYAGGHSTLGIVGSLSYFLGLHDRIPGPVSPSAWLTISALQQSGAAMSLSEKTSLDTKVEDFLRDYRFDEGSIVRLRPGWRFLTPVVLRETSRST